jgi:threonine dehydrogenase-like Zn-dependent dehydrogenase
MQALIVEDGTLTYLADYPAPRPEPGQALIRLLLAGICATDLEIIKGYAGFSGVLGHEFVGRVAAAGDPDWIGRRVVGTINIGCGRCAACLTGNQEHCPQRRVLGIRDYDGAFADYLVLPLANLLPVPDEVPDDEAVFTEPLAAALRIRQQLAVRPADRVAVIGPGRLGLLVGQVLALAGTQVIMLGRRPESLALLGRRPESLALPGRLGLDAGLAEEMAGDSFDLVVEATGSATGLTQALRLVRPLGTLVMKSTYAGAAAVDLTKLVVGEVTVVGSRCGPFAPALRLLAQGQIKVREMIDTRYPLSQGPAALEHAARPGVLKVLLTP